MTTNPATQPFWVVAGGGIDVKEEFGKSELAQFLNSTQTAVSVVLLLVLCWYQDVYKRQVLSSCDHDNTGLHPA